MLTKGLKKQTNKQKTNVKIIAPMKKTMTLSALMLTFWFYSIRVMKPVSKQQMLNYFHCKKCPQFCPEYTLVDTKFKSKYAITTNIKLSILLPGRLPFSYLGTFITVFMLFISRCKIFQQSQNVAWILKRFTCCVVSNVSGVSVYSKVFSS